MTHTDWNSAYAPMMETIEYELQRFSASVYFAPEVLHRMEMHHVAMEAGRGTVLKIVGAVATWRQERMLKVPANWWEHFKQRWYPKWALKRWPVLYEWYDAAVILPRVPVVRPEYHTVEFALWQKRAKE